MIDFSLFSLTFPVNAQRPMYTPQVEVKWRYALQLLEDALFAGGYIRRNRTC